MVNLATVVQSNQRYAAGHHQGLTAVFAGATTGIGRATLERTAAMLQSSTFYIIGRNARKYAALIEQLEASAPSNKFVFVEAQLSLIADVDDASGKIASSEQHVDLLCMSPGGIPFAGAKCSSPPVVVVKPLGVYVPLLTTHSYRHAGGPGDVLRCLILLAAASCVESAAAASEGVDATRPLHSERHPRDHDRRRGHQSGQEMVHSLCDQPHHPPDQLGI